MRLTKHTALVVVSASLLLTTAFAFVLSPRLRHSVNKIIVTAEMSISTWRGHKPRLASITGESGIPGARVHAIDSRSGWAALCDSEGRFVLPDVMWYPNASYELIVSTDDRRGRRIRVSTPGSSLPAGILNAGAIATERGGDVELPDLPGLTSISYQEYDFLNGDYYRRVYDELTAGKHRDAERIDAINRYISEKLNYNETQWEFGSPRRILERGSQYCGHLALAMATISAVAYPTRVVSLSDGDSPPNTHVVVELFYEGEWHLYDPTFGVRFENREGRIASYKDIRLDPGLISQDSFAGFREKYPKVSLSWMTRVYSSGYHHFYYLAFRCSQYSHAWWAYKDRLSYVSSGGRVWLAAAGVRPGTRVTFHIRKEGSADDALSFTTRGTGNSSCVLNEEESPPIALAPGAYEVFVDLRDGNAGSAVASGQITARRLSEHLEVR